MIKDLVSFLLDLNIYVHKSDTTNKRLFNYAIKAIKYYWSIRPLISTKSIFFQLVGLSPFVRPPTNYNCIKSESDNKNNNISNKVDISNKIENEVF